MKPLRDRIEERIRDTICRACVYEKAGGGCALEKMACPIINRIDKVIDVVRTTRSDRIDPYVERLRQVVCNECSMQDAGGHCPMRAHSDCALDDYFVLLVDLVEQELATEARTRRQPRTAPPSG
jgi:hypothetical protein